MNIEQMTAILQNIIMQAVQLAQEKQSPDIKPEHILYAMVNDDSLEGIWQRLHISQEELRSFIEQALQEFQQSVVLHNRSYQMMSCKHITMH